jgi:hypothetical protein
MHSESMGDLHINGGLADGLILGLYDLPGGVLAGRVQADALSGFCVNTIETSTTDATAD